MTTTDQQLLEETAGLRLRMDAAEADLVNLDTRVLALEQGTPEPPPPPPTPGRTKVEVYIGGLFTAAEVNDAHAHGWRWGYQVHAGNLDTTLAFLGAAANKGAKVHLLIGDKMELLELAQLLDHPHFDHVAQFEVEPDHGAQRPSGQLWTEANWIAFRDMVTTRGLQDRFYANKQTYSSNTPDHIPASAQWPHRARNYYPLNNQPKYFPKSGKETYNVVSNAGMREMANWIHADESHKGSLICQIGRQDWQENGWDGRHGRKWLQPTMDHMHYWLLQCEHYGIEHLTFWSARMGMAHGIDYLWDFSRSGLFNGQQRRKLERHWDDLLTIVANWHQGTLADIRPGFRGTVDTAALMQIVDEDDD